MLSKSIKLFELKVKNISETSYPKIGISLLLFTYLRIYIYMVFTTDGFFEVAIESWPEWDLNPRPLNSVQTL